MDHDQGDLGAVPGNGKDLSGGLPGLERKFARFGQAIEVEGGTEISGYASLFGDADQGGDVVEAGAYAASLKAVAAAGRSIKMLWQHDPAQPIGIWDEVCEDARGLEQDRNGGHRAVSGGGGSPGGDGFCHRLQGLPGRN